MTVVARGVKREKVSWKKDFKTNGAMYLLAIPTLLYFIIFHYIPMAGILIAFQDYRISRGIWGSEWVGFENFVDLFTGETFPIVMRNTLAMGFMNVIIGFVMPILFAILLSELPSKKYKRFSQVVSYMPHFVAAVVVSQLVREFVSANGAVTGLLSLFGLQKQNWLANPDVPVFWFINTFTNVWQEIGYDSILYVAVIATVSQDYHEAAAIDGANRFQRLLHITLPSIKHVIVMMLIMKVGLVLTTGFDKILLLYMPSTYDTADVLSTYTYRMAFSGRPNYGLSTASGLFQSVMSILMLLTTNFISKKVSGTGLI